MIANTAHISREKPLHINHICSDCGQNLTLFDLLDGPCEPDQIWYDEWACSNEDCPNYSILLFDWTEEQIKHFSDCMSEENMKKAEEW